MESLFPSQTPLKDGLETFIPPFPVNVELKIRPELTVRGVFTLRMSLFSSNDCGTYDMTLSTCEGIRKLL